MEIRLLGDVMVRPGPDALWRAFVGGSQARVAFALLALGREHGVTRDALAEAIWPDSMPAAWASALRNVVSRVRSFVASTLPEARDGEDLIVVRAGTYRLRLPDDTTIDVELAEGRVGTAAEALAERRLSQALEVASDATAQLRGAFLPEHTGDWVTRQRGRLAELLITGLELASQAACGLGDRSQALSTALEAVGLAPVRESAYRCLMAAHTVAGNRAEALRVYQRLRRTLADELGVDPDEETEAAYLRLLGGLAAPSAADDAGRSVLQRTTPAPFVGRQDELAAAAVVWSRVLASMPQVILVTGPAGIGKTRFATEFAQRVTTDGALVLFGRNDEEATVPYQAFVEVLDGLVAATPDDVLPAQNAAARVELGATILSLAGATDKGGMPERAVLLDAVARLVHHAALDHPLLVVLDDLQWADGDTLFLVNYLLRHVVDTRLLVMAIARVERDPGQELSRLVQAFDPEGLITRLHLGGLDQAACMDLVRQVLPNDVKWPSASRLIADSSGNPFMLIELLRAYEDDAPSGWPRPAQGPSALDDLVISRLAMLGPSARALLRAASVAGSHFDLEIAGTAAALDQAVALEALEAAMAHGFVDEVSSRVRASRYRFAHDVVRRSLYGRLSRARRRDLHTRLADALEDRLGDRAADEAAVLAHHRCAAAEGSGDRRAVSWALQAAAQMQSRGAPAEARRWCLRALDHVPAEDPALEAEVLTELGVAQTQAGDAAGESTLIEAAMRALRSGRIDIAARAALGMASLARLSAHVRDDARALVSDVLAHQRSGSGAVTRLPPVVVARLTARQCELGSSVSAAVDVSQMAEAAAALERHISELDRPAQVEERLELARDLCSIAQATRDPRVEVVASHHLAMATAVIGDDAATEDALRSMARAVEAQGDPYGKALLEERALMLAVTQGRFAEAGRMTVAADRIDEPASVAMAGKQLLVARWLQGRLGEDPVDLSDPDPAEGVLLTVEQGQRGMARIAVRALLAGDTPFPPGDGWLHSMGLLGLAAVELGDPAVASNLCRRLAPFVSLSCGAGYRTFVGTITFHLGRLAALSGHWAEAERHLSSALRQLTAIRARPWIALTQHALAEVIDARGRSSDRAWIAALRAQAQWLATDLGLRPLTSVRPETGGATG